MQDFSPEEEKILGVVERVFSYTLIDCIKEVKSKWVKRIESWRIYREHNRSQVLVTEAIEQGKTITIDMDLTEHPVSENAQGAKNTSK